MKCKLWIRHFQPISVFQFTICTSWFTLHWEGSPSTTSTVGTCLAFMEYRGILHTPRGPADQSLPGDLLRAEGGICRADHIEDQQSACTIQPRVDGRSSGISNPLFGEPVVCTPDSRGFRHFRGFHTFRKSSTQLLVCCCLSSLHRFVVSVISAVFVKGDPHVNHRFGKPWVDGDARAH